MMGGATTESVGTGTGVLKLPGLVLETAFVDGFRGLEEATLSFTDMNATCIGESDTPKSSWISFFSFLKAMAGNEVREWLARNNWSAHDVCLIKKGSIKSQTSFELRFMRKYSKKGTHKKGTVLWSGKFDWGSMSCVEESMTVIDSMGERTVYDYRRSQITIGSGPLVNAQSVPWFLSGSVVSCIPPSKREWLEAAAVRNFLVRMRCVGPVSARALTGRGRDDNGELGSDGSNLPSFLQTSSVVEKRIILAKLRKITGSAFEYKISTAIGDLSVKIKRNGAPLMKASQISGSVMRIFFYVAAAVIDLPSFLIADDVDDGIPDSLLGPLRAFFEEAPVQSLTAARRAEFLKEPPNTKRNRKKNAASDAAKDGSSSGDAEKKNETVENASMTDSERKTTACDSGTGKEKDDAWGVQLLLPLPLGEDGNTCWMN